MATDRTTAHGKNARRTKTPPKGPGARYTEPSGGRTESFGVEQLFAPPRSPRFSAVVAPKMTDIKGVPANPAALAKQVAVLGERLTLVERALRHYAQEAAKRAERPAAMLATVHAAAEEGGQAQLRDWVADGVLIKSKEFAVLRGVTAQALHKAAERGGLFSMKIRGDLYYPSVLARIDEETATALCRSLAPLSKVQKLLFLLRKHGALGGKTVVQAVDAGRAARVLELAAAWAAEERETA